MLYFENNYLEGAHEEVLHEEVLFKDLGTDTTTAIRIFLTQAVAYNGFPFEIRKNSTAKSPYTPMSEESILKKLDESKKLADQGQCRRADDVVADMRGKYGL